MPPRPALRALAARLGITSSYRLLSGKTRQTRDATRVAVLAAMGVDAADEAAARRALADLAREARERLLDPVQVALGRRTAPVIRLRAAPGSREAVSWRVELVQEDGATTVREGRARPQPGGWIPVALPTNPATGYHLVHVQARDARAERSATQRLIVAPPSCYTVGEALGKRRAFGVIANLYAVRGERDWGVGDVSDLGDLAEWAAAAGAAFVGTSPLHALRNRGDATSPYSPVSRLFRNELYVDIAAIPELRDCPEARGRIASAAFQEQLARRRAASRVDYEGVMALKWPVLQALFQAFVERHARAGTERGRAYRSYKERQGEALERYATFLALEHHFVSQGPPVPWHEWPAEYRDPGSPAVAAFRAAHGEVVERHCYLQFELDRQLAEAARRGAAAGLALGLYQDLAVGTAGDGSDPWAFPGLFAHGVTVGSPPDDYAQGGQDWSFPPVDPRRLAERQYDYWIRLLRAVFAHSGALRIDHAMGLLRLYWIPRGAPATEGCYVRYPVRELFGILALESRRHQAIVIGEDLGTVPRGFATLLGRWGVLSSRVLYFERDRRGGFRAAARYSPRALVTATTHDHAPLAGYRRGRDLELRRAAGQIASDAELERMRAARTRELAALERRLRSDGAVARGASVGSDAGFVGAVHRFLARTPAPLVGVYLDDLVSEADPVNLPGVRPERYAGWSRRHTVPVAGLKVNAEVSEALRGLESRGTRV